MPGEISAPVSLVYGFLLVVARVGGTFVFVPIPGLRNAAAPVKVALWLALPVVALLLMVDLSLAMLGRIHSQLQLLSLSFPLQMLAGLAILTVLLSQLPSLYEQMARPVVEMAMRFARQ